MLVVLCIATQLQLWLQCLFGQHVSTITALGTDNNMMITIDQLWTPHQLDYSAQRCWPYSSILLAPTKAYSFQKLPYLVYVESRQRWQSCPYRLDSIKFLVVTACNMQVLAIVYRMVFAVVQGCTSKPCNIYTFLLLYASQQPSRSQAVEPNTQLILSLLVGASSALLLGILLFVVGLYMLYLVDEISQEQAVLVPKDY